MQPRTRYSTSLEQVRLEVDDTPRQATPPGPWPVIVDDCIVHGEQQLLRILSSSEVQTRGIDYLHFQIMHASTCVDSLVNVLRQLPELSIVVGELHLDVMEFTGVPLALLLSKLRSCENVYLHIDDNHHDTTNGNERQPWGDMTEERRSELHRLAEALSRPTIKNLRISSNFFECLADGDKSNQPRVQRATRALNIVLTELFCPQAHYNCLYVDTDWLVLCDDTVLRLLSTTSVHAIVYQAPTPMCVSTTPFRTYPYIDEPHQHGRKQLVEQKSLILHNKLCILLIALRHTVSSLRLWMQIGYNQPLLIKSLHRHLQQMTKLHTIDLQIDFGDDKEYLVSNSKVRPVTLQLIELCRTPTVDKVLVELDTNFLQMDQSTARFGVDVVERCIAPRMLQWTTLLDGSIEHDVYYDAVTRRRITPELFKACFLSSLMSRNRQAVHRAVQERLTARRIFSTEMADMICQFLYPSANGADSAMDVT